MTIEAENLVTLKSTKAQLEVGLIYLKRRHSELERQLALVQSQHNRTRLHPDALLQLQRTVQDHAIQIERRKREIQELDERIHLAQTQTERNGLQYLSAEHAAVTAQISEIREQILASLRQLAGPLRRYEELVEQKNRLVRDIAERTGRDQAYANYIESALLRQSEYVDDVKYTVETLRRQRVVA
jgi:small-conductance mechanosensitive channel